VIVIMQENRSFDSYFGTYPGADGIPMDRGEPLVCSFDPKTRRCIEPFHDPKDRNVGGPHDHRSPAVQIDPDVLAAVVVSVHSGLPQR